MNSRPKALDQHGKEKEHQIGQWPFSPNATFAAKSLFWHIVKHKVVFQAINHL
jgi:hypothetical protein